MQCWRTSERVKYQELILNARADICVRAARVQAESVVNIGGDLTEDEETEAQSSAVAVRAIFEIVANLHARNR